MKNTYRRILLKTIAQSSSITLTLPFAVFSNAQQAATSTGNVSIFDFMSEDQKADVAAGRASVDVSGAIQSALNSSPRVMFPDGTYLMRSGVKKIGSGVSIDFGRARIINDLPNAGFLFSFGATADVPRQGDLQIRGGYFEQSDPGTPLNRNYIRIAATRNFSIRDVHLKNVGNGGLYVEAGCEDGVIDSVAIEGRCQHSPCRGIWLNGSTASDFVGQLIDIASITRNSALLPSHAIKKVAIRNCTITLPFYGVYLMNTRDCQITGNRIDISGGGARCLALNNYSPGAIVRNNTLISNQSSTGILCTQYSHDVLIDDNTFQGSFGGGRDIYIAYRAEAIISSNRFTTGSTQQILIDMGGTAVIRGNQFSLPGGYQAGAKCVRFTTIDEAVAGTGIYGNAATVLPGILFEGNTVRQRNCPILVNTPAARNGNVPGLETVTVRNNQFHDMNTAAAADEYGLKIYANGSTHVVKYAYAGNLIYPVSKADRNSVRVQGTGAMAAGL
jgi:hypothetical protein